jgi:predicted DsbA family dithiol-disulfide isomerase
MESEEKPMTELLIEKCGHCRLRYAERGGMFRGACCLECWSRLPYLTKVKGKVIRRTRVQCRYAPCRKMFTPEQKGLLRAQYEAYCSDSCRHAHQERQKARRMEKSRWDRCWKRKVAA